MLTLNFRQSFAHFTLEMDETLPTQGISAIFGLSGAGKTSLINVISGLSRPQTGKIYLNDQPLVDVKKGIFIPVNRRRIGYVLQEAHLFPHYSVKGNLCYGMARNQQSNFDAIISLLGIESLLTRYPATLSGGEKQRVAIGRALLSQPQLLLMDEPLASLDLLKKREFMPYLATLSHEVNIPILYVSHSLYEISQLAQQLLVLSQGRAIANDRLEKVWLSDHLLPWLDRENRSTLLQAKLVRQHDHYPLSALQLTQQIVWVDKQSVPLGSQFRLQIHASDIIINELKQPMSPGQNQCYAKVVAIQVEINCVIIKFMLDEQLLLVELKPWYYQELKLQVGEVRWLHITKIEVKSVMAIPSDKLFDGRNAQKTTSA